MDVQYANKTLSASTLREQIRDCYIYAYPLVVMDITRLVSTNVSSATEAMASAPMNQFAQMREFVPAIYHAVVRPNADTLYSMAWVDLGKEPLVLDVGDTGSTYYLLPILSAWTNVNPESPGSRVTGAGPGTFALCGPNFTGTLPEGVTAIHVPTNMAWIIGRTECKGEADYENVWAIQNGYRLTPLSVWPKPYSPPINVPKRLDIDMKTAPPLQVEALSLPDASPFFTYFCSLMEANPQDPPDPAMSELLSVMGFTPNAKIDFNEYPDGTVSAIQAGVQDAISLIQSTWNTMGTQKDGWQYPATDTGVFGTNYINRAAVAYGGLGANLWLDAVYPLCFSTPLADGSSEPLDGSQKYVLRFPPNLTPPAKGFWSVTAYDQDGYFIPNLLKRYSVHNWDTTPNADGSLEIYIQAGKPDVSEELSSNWLPVAEGKPFNLTMRIYWPNPEPPSVLDGSWTAPAVQKV